MQKASALEFERYLGLVFSDLCARDNGLEKKTINFDTFNAVSQIKLDSRLILNLVPSVCINIARARSPSICSNLF